MQLPVFWECMHTAPTSLPTSGATELAAVGLEEANCLEVCLVACYTVQPPMSCSQVREYRLPIMRNFSHAHTFCIYPLSEHSELSGCCSFGANKLTLNNSAISQAAFLFRNDDKCHKIYAQNVLAIFYRNVLLLVCLHHRKGRPWANG